jgi:DNA-binding transcriptional regulator YiaG
MRGLAMLHRGKDGNRDCESTAAKAILADQKIAIRNMKQRALAKFALELPVQNSQPVSIAVIPDQMSFPHVLKEVRAITGMSAAEISQLIGASLVSVVRWERGDNQPGTDMATKILALYTEIKGGHRPTLTRKSQPFASRGARKTVGGLPLFRHRLQVPLSDHQQGPLIHRLQSSSFWGAGEATLQSLLQEYSSPSRTIDQPATSAVSAGKNTYTYDAHTYHTKVPPQGIAQILRQYLPEGGLILDPFAGSGMTGVAARAVGYDVILNDLSPAASFIADRFTRARSTTLIAARLTAGIISPPHSRRTAGSRNHPVRDSR